MPSPFPGMDPYLESPAIWPDLHDAMAGEIRNELNQILPSPYYARLEMRPEIGIEEDRSRQRIVPDVTVVRYPSRPTSTEGTAVLNRPRRDVSSSFDIKVRYEKIRHHFVEIRDAAQGHKLITLIEILSPSNKRPGPDRESYREKQLDVLRSDANLIEIDLLRSGARVLPELESGSPFLEVDPAPDYLILVNRASQRDGATMGFQAFGSSLREWLPCIPVPLKPGEPEPPLDLQYVFNRAYDGGPYRRGAVDYSAPPDPPLPEADAAWAAALVRGGSPAAPR